MFGIGHKPQRYINPDTDEHGVGECAETETLTNRNPEEHDNKTCCDDDAAERPANLV